MSHHQVQSVLIHYGKLFWFCKLLGIYPHDLGSFQRDGVLKKSKLGSWIVIAAMIIVAILYNLLIYSFAEEDRTLKATQSTLTFVIGIFLTYIGLVMMATDQFSAIKNQQEFNDVYDRIKTIDDRLFRENVVVDNSSIAPRIRNLITISIVSELLIMVSTYVVLVDFTQWKSLLWAFSCLPTFFNSLDKIWFAVTLHALRLRFAAINTALEELVESHEKFKAWIESGGEAFTAVNGNQYGNNMNYLYDDMNYDDTKSMKGASGKNKVAPIAHSMNTFGEEMLEKQDQQNPKAMINMAYESELNNIQKTEQKFNHFCQIHDEICEIGKALNDVFSYPILILMAYGFLIFTAQLYFLYCGTQNQGIPSLFRSSRNAVITAIFLTYTAGKCIYIIYLSWKTSLESKRTGICLHKCGVVVDNYLLYEIVNHLSLKLLNHSADFSACGFFTLDMETLYGVSGGITSYLIILIQFNLAAQQAKEAIFAFSNFNETAHMMGGSEDGDNATFLELLTTTLISTTTNLVETTTLSSTILPN